MYIPIWCSLLDCTVQEEMQSHRGMEFIMMAHGEADITVEGTTYTLDCNSILIVDGFERHYVSRAEDQSEHYCLILSPSEAQKHPFVTKMSSFLSNRSSGFVRSFPVGENAREIHRVFELLAEECNKDDSYHSEYMLSLTEQLLILLFRNHPERDKIGSSSQRTMEIKSYIDLHFAEDISVNSLAKRFFMSKEYLIREYRRATGYSPGKYILYSRLSHAKELLERTDYSLPVVASQSGFNDLSNFIRTFNKQFHISPGKYRKKNRTEK